MKQILLTRDKVAPVDDEDYERLSRYKWQALKDRTTWYACRTVRRHGQRRVLLMHREILGIKGREREVDHKDGNGLDNRRNNLRVATLSQNRFNAGKYSTNKSGYKGVSFDAQSRRWVAQIAAHGKKFSLGRYNTPEDAARAHDAVAKRTNRPLATRIEK